MAFDATGNLADLATALCALQGELPAVAKGGTGQIGQTRGYKYATLQDVWTVVQPLLAKHGLCVVQTPVSAPLSFGEKNANVGVATILLHQSGSYISSTLWLPLSQITAQGAGSAITYARRYALCAVLGVVADDDDDAASAGAPAPTKRARSSAQPTPGTSRTTAAGEPVAAAIPPAPPVAAVITEPMRKRLYAIRTHVPGWTDDTVKALIQRHGFASSKLITRGSAYDAIVAALEAGPDAPTGVVKDDGLDLG